MEGESGDPGPLGLFLAGRPGKPGTPMLSKSYSYNPAFKYFGFLILGINGKPFQERPGLSHFQNMKI